MTIREFIRDLFPSTKWLRRAVIISLAAHAAFLIVAGSIVILRHLTKPEVAFVSSAPPPPSLELRKLELKVKVQDLQKQSARPRLQPRLAALRPADIALPEIKKITKEDPRRLKSTLASIGRSGYGSGVGGGLGEGHGGGMGGGLPLMLSSRCDPVQRIRNLSQYGGDARTEPAVIKSLNWLKNQQNSDGSWGNTYPVAMTGLALLAYLGHCETPESPQFGSTVRRAIEYLVAKGENGQRLQSRGGNGASYEHGIATFALAEAYTMTRLKNIPPVLEPAVYTIVSHQSGEDGWEYNYAGGLDMSVTAWQVQALKAAHLTGLNLKGVPEALQRAATGMKRRQDGQGHFLYKVSAAHRAPNLTPAGAYCLVLTGATVKEEVRKALDVSGEHFNKANYDSEVSLYGWYYMTLATFQKGGATWSKWNRLFSKQLLDRQGGDGSWPSEGGAQTADHAKGDADVYRTCLCTLMLEVYYRYLPSSK